MNAEKIAQVEQRQVYRSRDPRGLHPVLRVVCRYPLDPEDAPARWIVERVTSCEHLLIIPEATLLLMCELQEGQT